LLFRNILQGFLGKKGEKKLGWFDSAHQVKIQKVYLNLQGIQRGATPFGRSFGKEGSLRGENPFYRKKWVFSPHKVSQLYQS